MKLRKITPADVPSYTKKEERPCIKLKHNGSVYFNGPAAELIGLKGGDEVIFVQDEDHPGDWFVSKIKSGGWKLRPLKDSTAVQIQSAGLVKNIFETCEINPGKELVKMLLAGTATKDGKDTYWGILTNSATWQSKI